MDVDSFVRDGFVAVRQAVDASTAACRELVWQSMARRGLRRSEPATWPPLVRIDDLDAGPFTAAGGAGPGEGPVVWLFLTEDRAADR